MTRKLRRGLIIFTSILVSMSVLITALSDRTANTSLDSALPPVLVITILSMILLGMYLEKETDIPIRKTYRITSGITALSMSAMYLTDDIMAGDKNPKIYLIFLVFPSYHICSVTAKFQIFK
jgi:hypothetical protein